MFVAREIVMRNLCRSYTKRCVTACVFVCYQHRPCCILVLPSGGNEGFAVYTNPSPAVQV